MICLVGRWSLSAAFVTAALALTACAGSNGSPVPLAPDQISPAGFHDSGAQLHAMTSEGLLPATCPKQYINCFTVSLKHGLVVDWCYGSQSAPCGKTKNYKWSGAVCHSTAKTCKPIEQLTAKWTGPFQCKKTIKPCGGSTKGTYEVDAISKGKTPPKQTKQYLYKQVILLSGAIGGYVGLNVGP
jgi:hypothetical protein